MKKLILLTPFLICTFIVCAQPPAGPADKGMNFGVQTTLDGAINAEDLGASLSGATEKELKVKGKVVEVCQAEGCWLKMQTAGGTMMIRMKDHSFMVPLSMNGKTIVAQGTVAVKETSVQMLKHYAEDGGKTKAEIAAIKKPKKEMTMQATGIVVL